MEHKKQHDAPSGMGRIELFCQHRPPGVQLKRSREQSKMKAGKIRR